MKDPELQAKFDAVWERLYREHPVDKCELLSTKMGKCTCKNTDGQ